ncbi:MAG: hypothetical protein EVB08_01775 [Synechococcus sp. MED-G135]|nr:MAG: hypothetical protein EVB08_01775 [Synechococcus sp. MED-G135]
MGINVWMIIGFLVAASSVVANDSLQTLGTYISSNKTRTPKAWQMLFICAVTVFVLMLGWFLNNGEPAWGRLDQFPLPEQVTWVYIIPPLAVLALSAWGAPVSTSFLLLSAFVPETIPKLLGSSLFGYALAFCLGLATWGLGLWLLERWVFRQMQAGTDVNKVWYGLQWFSTGFLWSMWMVQDLANIFVFLPRTLAFIPMVMCSLSLCVGLCVLVAIGGGPLQTVLRTKTNTADLRSATLIDIIFGLCLGLKSLFSTFPLSTTWVFLGLLGGREIALRIKEQQIADVFTNSSDSSLGRSLGSDVFKAFIGVVISLAIALGIQPLITWSAA